MYVNLDDIPEKGATLAFEETLEKFPVLKEIHEAGECEFLSPITCHVKVIRVRHILEVRGFFKVSIRLACCRCLKSYDSVLTSHFELSYTNDLSDLKKNMENKEIALEVQDAGFIFFQNNEIDLLEGLQEQIVLSIPMQCLCSKDCRGLCVTCGYDLNQGDCGCDPAAMDTRFAVLKHFKDCRFLKS